MNRRSFTVFLALGTSSLTPLSLPSHAADEPALYTGLPYRGQRATLPGTIQAEEYDIAPDAKNGISFNYNGQPGKSAVRTSPDSIGLARFGNGHVSIKGEPKAPESAYAGWTQDGEWLKYSVHIDEAGTYRIGGQFSAAGKGGLLSFSFSPTLTTGPVEIPTTDGYQPGVEVYHVWEKLDNLAEIELPKGDAVLTVKIEKNAGINLDYFTFTRK